MLPSQIPIDEMFDLDLALKMAVDLADDHQAREDDDGSEAAAAAVRHLDEVLTAATAESGGQCAVCTEGLRFGGAAKRTPCGHVFHQDCISRWLSVNYSCPLCREKCPSPPGNISSV